MHFTKIKVFYHSSKEHACSFWPCYIRYALFITDKLPVRFFLLISFLQLSLETTYRLIHQRFFFPTLLVFSFLSLILVSLCFLFRYYLELLQIYVSFTKKNIFHFFLFHFIYITRTIRLYFLFIKFTPGNEFYCFDNMIFHITRFYTIAFRTGSVMFQLLYTLAPFPNLRISNVAAEQMQCPYPHQVRRFFHFIQLYLRAAESSGVTFFRSFIVCHISLV